MPTTFIRIALCALFVAMECPAGADQVISGRVRLGSGTAPADVLIQAFIEPNVENRLVSFVVESEDFYASSSAELDGDRAPRAKEVRFRMLPPGDYEVLVTLFRADGERGTFLRRFTLL